MSTILLHLLAIFPGILICFLIYRSDKYEKEAKTPLLICFLLGVVSAFPALKLEELGDRAGIDEFGGFWMLILLSFIVIALSEELVKFMVLFFYPFRKKFFNEPFDGIVYSVVIAMGFATIENMIYADLFGRETTILRAFTAVPAHAIFGVVMGYFIGIARFDSKNRLRYLAYGLGSAIFLHGIYDFFILQQYYEWLMLFATFTLLLSGYLSFLLIKTHQDASPFKPFLSEENISNNHAESDEDIMNSIISDMEEE